MHNRKYRGMASSGLFHKTSGTHPLNTLHVPSNGLFRGGICL